MTSTSMHAMFLRYIKSSMTAFQLSIDYLPC